MSKGYLFTSPEDPTMCYYMTRSGAMWCRVVGGKWVKALANMRDLKTLGFTRTPVNNFKFR